MNSFELSLASRRQPHSVVGEAYLKFQIAPQTSGLLAMKTVQEVLILPAHQLTPMPNMAVPVLGLMNRRSKVFWVVDLAQMLRFPSTPVHLQQYNIVVIQVERLLIGLAVQSVEGMARFMPEMVHAPPRQVSPELVPYLRGCVLHQDQIHLILEAEAIVHSAVLRQEE